MEKTALTPASGFVVALRGGGDIATGVAQKLWRSGFSVLVLETENPTAIRRTVALSTAVEQGTVQVEDLVARQIFEVSEVEKVWSKGEIPVLVDPECCCFETLHPSFVVDAIIAKRNLGTHRGMAPVTIALGPGFSAPEDVDVVVETMRGHTMGQLIFKGGALPNTGTPGLLGGKTGERVVHAPVSGKVRHLRSIGDRVGLGEEIFAIGETVVTSPLEGTLRGLIGQGIHVRKGQKSADVDPRPAAEVDCLTISDKARAIGGAVLEACFFEGRRKGVWNHVDTDKFG